MNLAYFLEINNCTEAERASLKAFLFALRCKGSFTLVLRILNKYQHIL